ncbi:hypothetical protein LNKW23_29910 [Paralimibaculum aggregatum]|uniref:Uncharacterized protein n=1 Tax=Paralimibaculum aggregatum TaxID=3036245 RepID=A0ABQ6LKJ7_9RHOB|nr:hypothetical protein LNKW23_29910 [Limibaculum sp. NKW23]
MILRQGVGAEHGLGGRDLVGREFHGIWLSEPVFGPGMPFRAPPAVHLCGRIVAAATEGQGSQARPPDATPPGRAQSALRRLRRIRPHLCRQVARLSAFQAAA